MSTLVEDLIGIKTLALQVNERDYELLTEIDAALAKARAQDAATTGTNQTPVLQQMQELCDRVGVATDDEIMCRLAECADEIKAREAAIQRAVERIEKRREVCHEAAVDHSSIALYRAQGYAGHKELRDALRIFREELGMEAK